jgi:D-serine deaminase-like pyridoxal phosphate-dependent protein
MSSPSSREQLRARYVGKTLHEVPTPSCVLDLAKLDVNCKQMVDAVQRLGLGWRPHIKTHKVCPRLDARPIGPSLLSSRLTSGTLHSIEHA